MITLKTLPQATAQGVFDQVAKHLLTQNQRAMASSGMCKYRNVYGLKCAAGCLMGDDDYMETLEGADWGTLAYKGIVPEAHANLIGRLQLIHDKGEPENWRTLLANLAEELGLTFNA